MNARHVRERVFQAKAMRGRRTVNRYLISAVFSFAVGVIILSVAACTSADHTTPRGRPRPTIDTESMLAAADRAVDTASNGGAPINIGDARILANPPIKAGSLSMSTDRGPILSGGSYTLVVYCAGSGHVTARLSVGKSAASLTAACQMVPEPIRLHVRARQACEATVELAAGDREPIAVAYELAASSNAAWLVTRLTFRRSMLRALSPGLGQRFTVASMVSRRVGRVVGTRRLPL